MKRILSLILSALFLILSVPASFADEVTVAAEPAPVFAEEITDQANIWSYDIGSSWYLTDKSETSYEGIGYSGVLNIESEVPVAGLYVKFYGKGAGWTLAANEKAKEFGQNGFLHEFVDVAAFCGEATNITMTFDRGAEIAEIELYSAGTLPDSVQVWQPPCEKADLLLFSSHADDEQLFFAGVLPYSVAYGARTQVVYFCEHSDNAARQHEQLNGLWAAGVRNYPVMGKFPDLYSESRDGAVEAFGYQGYTVENMLEWQVENIRRFKPQVVIGHDVDGEYGHGTHIINSETLREAVEVSMDETKCPYSAVEYGVWDVPKTYLHLYAENALTMDFDVPLDHFGGKTAFEMTVAGFGEHYSQHWTWFYDWIHGTDWAPITKASEITEYSPCAYGLYRTTVGYDTKADFFDHITLWDAIEEAEKAAAAAATEEVTEKVTEAPVTDAQTDKTVPGFKVNRGMYTVSAIVAGLIVVIIVLIVMSSRRAHEEKKIAEAMSRSREQAEKLREARAAQLRAQRAADPQAGNQQRTTQSAQQTHHSSHSSHSEHHSHSSHGEHHSSHGEHHHSSHSSDDQLGELLGYANKARETKYEAKERERYEDAARDESKPTPANDTTKPNTPVIDTQKPSAPAANAPKRNDPAANTAKPNTPVNDTQKRNAPAANVPKQNAPVNDTAKPRPTTPATNVPKQNNPANNAPKPNTPVTDTSKPRPTTPAMTAPKQNDPANNAVKPTAPASNPAKPDTPAANTSKPTGEFSLGDLSSSSILRKSLAAADEDESVPVKRPKHQSGDN